MSGPGALRGARSGSAVFRRLRVGRSAGPRDLADPVFAELLLRVFSRDRSMLRLPGAIASLPFLVVVAAESFVRFARGMRPLHLLVQATQSISVRLKSKLDFSTRTVEFCCRDFP